MGIHLNTPVFLLQKSKIKPIFGHLDLKSPVIGTKTTLLNGIADRGTVSKLERNHPFEMSKFTGKLAF